MQRLLFLVGFIATLLASVVARADSKIISVDDVSIDCGTTKPVSRFSPRRAGETQLTTDEAAKLLIKNLKGTCEGAVSCVLNLQSVLEAANGNFEYCMSALNSVVVQFSCAGTRSMAMLPLTARSDIKCSQN